MKRILTITALLVSQVIFAKTYYVSNAGNDANSGTSTGSSWATIKKVNSFSFASNDLVLFNRGDVFYGGIVIKRDNLSFGAYGSGANPVISGLSTVTGWVSLGGNIWEAPVTNVKADMDLVLRNDVIQQIGRYPNADDQNGGYLTFTASSSNSITGTAQSSKTDWTGADVVIKKNRWAIVRQKVTDHTGGVVYFPTTTDIPRVNYGYFFQNDSRTLDEDGEWWSNTSAKKLRMYFSSNNPNLYTIQVATVDTLFKCQSLNNILISDLTFDGSGKRAIWVSGGSGLTVKNCIINNSGAEAITAKSTLSVNINNCSVTNTLGTGINLVYNSGGTVNFVVSNCTISNTAVIPGMETAKDGSGGIGLRCMGGDGIQILNNSVTNSGYNAIVWQGNDIFIKYNLVDKFCTKRDDGAGIYSWESTTSETRVNRNIVSNIVLNGIGSNSGTNDKSTSVQGIYLDLGSRYVVIDSNTVANMPNGGIHGNNCANLTITNNVMFNNNRTISFQRFAGAASIRNLVIKNNFFYPYRFRYRNLGINSPAMTKEADMRAMGTIDNNFYSLGLKEDTSLTTVTTYADGSNYEEDYFDFSYLTGTVGIEKSSKKLANNGTLEYNASNSAKTITFSGLSKLDGLGNVFNNAVTIPAWGSKILLPNGTAATSNKLPIADAGAALTISLPIATVTLSGRGTDQDGTITKYSWAKISGPSTGTIITPLGSLTILLNLSAGVYKYELTVTDNSGGIGKDTVQVTVNPLLGNNYLPAVNPSNTVNGLDFKYYEATWVDVPDFSALVADKRGTVSNFDIGPADVAENFGFSFTGYINVPSDGMYTFYTSSDDGSNLYIDEVQVVSNGGLHGTAEESGVIGLKAGKHAIRGDYFQKGGGAVFNVSYESSSISKQAVPASALYRVNSLLPAVNPSNTINGLNYKYYEGTWLELPAFSTLTPVKTGTVSFFDISPARIALNFGFNFSGYINVPADGMYTFYTNSDDGSNLLIDNILLVANGGLHGPTEKSGVIGLQAGKHVITGLYFQKGGGALFNVSYESAGISKRIIPASALYRVSTTGARIGNGSNLNSGTSLSVVTDESTSDLLKVTAFPNPSSTEFAIRLEGGSGKNVDIAVITADGRKVFARTGPSNQTYQFGNNFMPGLYIVKVMQENKIQAVKVIKLSKPR